MKSFFDLRNLGVAFSLANLWFIVSWKQLIFTTNNHYFDFEPRSALEYSALFFDVLLLTGIFLFLLWLSEGKRARSAWVRRAAQVVFLILGLSAFGSLSSETIKWFSPRTINFVNVPIPLIVLLFCLIFSWKKKFRLTALAANLKLVPLFLLPFTLLIYFQLLWTGFVFDSEPMKLQSVEKEIPASHSPGLSKKVVWIVFDELDYAALSTAKENDTSLPELERLMSESFVARNAVAPSRSTLISIPALLTGRPLQKAETITLDNLLLYPKDEAAPFAFRESDHIFSETEKLNGKNAIVGWYHPYPRIFQEQASYIYWSSINLRQGFGFSAFTYYARDKFLDSLVNVPFAVRFFPSLWRPETEFGDEGRDAQNEWSDRQIERHGFLTGKAAELASNPKLNLLFFHFSVPHFPRIARTDLKGQETYFNSLEVVDDTIKKLREALEKAGQWDDAVFIVSSDHWWRSKTPADFKYLPEAERREVISDRRIPLIIKFAGQRARMDYEPAFNTIVTKEMILEVFREKIKNPDDFARWLDDLRIREPELINLQPEESADQPDIKIH